MEERDSTVKISATVYRELKEQTKAVTYQSNGVFSITPDVGYWLSNVSVTVDVAGGGALPVGTKFAYSTFSQIPNTTDLYNISNLDNMFLNCSYLSAINFPDNSLENVTSMSQTFRGCAQATQITFPDGALTTLKNMSLTFYLDSSLQSISFPDGALEQVTYIDMPFVGCNALEHIYLPNRAFYNLSDATGLFQSLSSLKELTLPPFSFENTTNCSSIFYNCWYLTKITITDGVLTNCRNFYGAFSGCFNLQTLQVLQLPPANLDNWGISTCTKLSPKSLFSIVNALYDLKSLGVTATCTLGSVNLSKLSRDQILIATNKGWTLN